MKKKVQIFDLSFKKKRRVWTDFKCKVYVLKSKAENQNVSLKYLFACAKKSKTSF